ncbi:UNVERIFIED_CONTAM: cytochrome C oxidase assembly protein, partial [Prevotella sp. 15_C9]
WVVIFGLAVVFLATIHGTLYINNNVNDTNSRARINRHLIGNTVLLLICFLAFLAKTLLGDGFAVATDGTIVMEPMNYL